jgi:hypothetical protein
VVLYIILALVLRKHKKKISRRRYSMLVYMRVSEALHACMPVCF